MPRVYRLLSIENPMHTQAPRSIPAPPRCRCEEYGAARRWRQRWWQRWPHSRMGVDRVEIGVDRIKVGGPVVSGALSSVRSGMKTAALHMEWLQMYSAWRGLLTPCWGRDGRRQAAGADVMKTGAAGSPRQPLAAPPIIAGQKALLREGDGDTPRRARPLQGGLPARGRR
ncbi:hypothetical protein E2C01_000288 [Portunus trituberculatus]|uniref:Uncharacterized protein n=1 Tax=Portunus trituberculatus TaxID=210409 RepID=A0A5B7CDP7_PORTR|nr:hypothetical protein [Portunus trituberculatus]